MKQFEYVSAITLDSKVAIWHCDRIMHFQDDLEELKPNKVVKSKWRITCLAINNLKDQKAPSKKKTKTIKKAKEAAPKETNVKKKKKRDKKAERKL